jgi:hypothetical protein
MPVRNPRPNPEPKLSDPKLPDHRPTLRLLLISIVVWMSSIGTSARAQNYPWCSNFADGAGTNCGFPTLEQCQATIAGSGGYCDQNTLYKTPVAPAATQRRKHKHQAGKNS